MDALFKWIQTGLTYLPPVLQAPILYWTLLICFATIYYLRRLPAGSVAPWQEQSLVFCIAALTTVPLMRDSLVYALGTALIMSSLSTSLYTVAIETAKNFIVKKLVSFGLISGAPDTSPETTFRSPSVKPLPTTDPIDK